MALHIDFKTKLFCDKQCATYLTSERMYETTLGYIGVIGTDCYVYSPEKNVDLDARLFSAKYIMEYLYNEHGYVPTNRGHSVLVTNRTEGSGWWHRVGQEESILAIEEDIQMAVVLIRCIAFTIYRYGNSVVSITMFGRIDETFLHWASETSLEGNVEITVLQDEGRVRHDSCFDTLGYLNRLEEQQRFELVKQHKAMVKLTPEREEEEYKRHCQIYEEEKTTMYPTFVCIRRMADGEFHVSHLYSDNYYRSAEDMFEKIQSKMSDDSVIECVILAYRRSYLPERMIYNKDADFYAGFYYKDGVLTKKKEEEAFKLFDSLYSQKADQEFERKYGHIEK